MRIVNPPAVYIVDRVLQAPRAKERLDRLMTRVDCETVSVVSDAELDEIVVREGWDGSRRLSGRERRDDPAIVFDTYRTGDDAGRRTGVQSRPHFRSGTRVRQRDGVVCQDGWGFNTGRGCLFKCDYCCFEDVLFLNLNLEEYLEHLDRTVRTTEGPTLWKWDNQTDILCFEPEMGAVKLFVEYFAQFDDQYLMTYSKSDNVEYMLDLDHGGQTICCWTLNAQTQSVSIERDAASMAERIEAAAQCERAGYRVRFRFSGICPVHNWQAENREMLDRLFETVHPDVISLETLSRMSNPQMFENVMQPDLFEPRFLEAIRRGSEEIAGKIWGPIPDDEREEIYRWFIAEIRARNASTPVSLCQEPLSMWKRLADVLEVDPAHYPCCCAKDSVPGGHPAFEGGRYCRAGSAEMQPVT